MNEVENEFCHIAIVINLNTFKGVVLAASTPIPTNLSGSIEPEKEETATEGVTTTPIAKGFKTKAVPDEGLYT